MNDTSRNFQFLYYRNNLNDYSDDIQSHKYILGKEMLWFNYYWFKDNSTMCINMDYFHLYMCSNLYHKIRIIQLYSFHNGLINHIFHMTIHNYLMMLDMLTHCLNFLPDKSKIYINYLLLRIHIKNKKCCKAHIFLYFYLHNILNYCIDHILQHM